MLPGGIGSLEMVLIGVVAVLLFGSRLPEVARSLGQSYQQLRKGLDEVKSSFNEDLDKDDSSYSNISAPEYQDVDDEQDPPDAPQFKPPA